MNKLRYWGMFSLLSAGLALTLAGCGGGGGGGGSTAVGNDSSYTSTAEVTTIAGSGSSGFKNDSGTSATFSAPTGIAIATVGSTTYLYVADTGSKAIRKIELAENFDVTTAANNGGTIGSSTVSLSAPKGIACDANNFYVTDSTNIYKINHARTSLETLISTGLNNATGIVYYNSTTFYIADHAYHTISSLSSTGTLALLAGSQNVFGTANTTAGRFNNPYGVTTDNNGNLYVSDYGNSTIRKIVISTGYVTTLAGLAGTNGTKDGTGTGARFNHPTGMAYYNGSLYVADTDNHAIRQVVIPTTEDTANPDSETAVVTTIAGYKGYAGFADGKGNAVKFSSPTGIVSAGGGVFYVTDKNNNRIRKIKL